MRLAFRSVAVLFSLTVIPAGVLPARSALACKNSIAAAEDRMVQVLTEADAHLREGRPGAALQLTLQHHPDLKTARDGDRFTARAQRIFAAALVRMEGLASVRGFDASTSDERRANLEWAVVTLRSADRRQKNNPAIQAELAEALSALPEHQQEAFHMLEDLARRDLVPNPYAYRALGRLRRLAGDEAAARAALEKAEMLHRTASRQAKATGEPGEN
jgi:hypothetical protein